METLPGVRTALRGAAILLVVACLPGMLGCFSGKFFVPTCQDTNSCGGGSGANSSYAYVANETLGTIEGFPLPTATFTSITGTSYSLGTPATALAGTPTGTFLYVATGSGVLLYTIGANGALTLGNGGSPVVTTGFAPTSMNVDPSGNFLFIVSSVSPVLFEYQINSSTGALTVVGSAQGTLLNGGTGTPTQVYVTPSDQYVYVGLGLSGMDSFALNSSTGALSNQGHRAPLASGGPADNAITADNKSAFLFVGETGKGIRVFTIGTGGALTEISGSPFTSLLGPKSIVVDPTNSYVYVANSTANAITGYTLAASGSLTALPSSPFTTGSGPVSMSLDSTGKYLLVICNGGSPDLQVFSFDATTGGELDSVATAATGTDPAGAISLSVVP